MLVVARNERSLGVLLLPRIVITWGTGGVAQSNKVCVSLLLSFSLVVLFISRMRSLSF